MLTSLKPAFRLMGLKEQFAHGREWVATNLTFTTNQVSEWLGCPRITGAVAVPTSWRRCARRSLSL